MMRRERPPSRIDGGQIVDVTNGVAEIAQVFDMAGSGSKEIRQADRVRRLPRSPAHRP